jgi:hypothetical protein
VTVADPLFIKFANRASLGVIIAHWWPETGWSEDVLAQAVILLILTCSPKPRSGCCGYCLQSIICGPFIPACRYREAMRLWSGANPDKAILAEQGTDAAGVRRLAEVLGVAPPSWLSAWEERFGKPSDAETSDPTPENEGSENADSVLAEMLTRYPDGLGHPRGRKGFYDEYNRRAPGTGLADEAIRSRIRRFPQKKRSNKR